MPAATSDNLLIEMLPRRERNRILDCGKLVELHFGAVLCEPDLPFRHVYFPLNGFISLMAPVTGHAAVETGLIGNEGLLGATLLLGVNAAPLGGVVQGAGSAVQLTTAQFRRELRDSISLHRCVGRYLYVLMAQLSQTICCTCFHQIAPRVARWLLMIHDCAHADQFQLTHQFLANMLGVRRSAVTIAAGDLQKRRVIQYTRGVIRILDRQGLEALSCGCYAAMRDDYARLFPQP